MAASNNIAQMGQCSLQVLFILFFFHRAYYFITAPIANPIFTYQELYADKNKASFEIDGGDDQKAASCSLQLVD